LITFKVETEREDDGRGRVPKRVENPKAFSGR
jgi:hypothetical protein